MNDESLMEREISSTEIYKGRILTLRLDDIALPDGRAAKREYVEHRGGASIFAIDADKNVYLVRQFRYPYREILLEIPAGKLEEGELPVETARRELTEETGLVGDVRPYGLIYPTPGYTNENLYIFIAENLKATNTHFDDDEFLDIVKMPFKELLSLVLNGTVRDSKTCYAVLRYALENNIRL